MNIAHLIGNLTRDPEFKQVQLGDKMVSVCQFSIAVNRRQTDAQGNRIADYFNVVAWRGLGETAAKYLSKGKKCEVTGMIKTRTYEKDGVKHKAFEIEASDIEFLSPRDEGQGQATGGGYQEATAAPAQGGGYIPVDTEELPF